MGLYWPQSAAKLARVITRRAQFEILVRTHQGAVRAFLRRLTREAALADDLAQDTFIKALSRLGELQEADAAKAWLFSIAYRCFLDSYKKTARRAKLFQDTHVEVTPNVVTGLALDIERAMAELPDDCRACVMLSLSDGYSHVEISQITDLPLGTVKSHVTRGKVKLQTALGAYRSSANDLKVT